MQTVAGTLTVAATVENMISLYCQCCGKEKLGEIQGTTLVIYDTRHGKRHFVVVDISKYLDRT